MFWLFSRTLERDRKILLKRGVSMMDMAVQ